MANKGATAAGLGLAMFLVLVAVWLAALGLTLDGDGKSHYGLSGFGTLSLLPLDGLLVLTLLAYALAFVVPHTRLALVQSIAIALYGLVMVAVGSGLIVTGLARFSALVTLMLAFPFGTIAYFIKYTCSSDPSAAAASLAAQSLGGSCFAGVQLVALVAAVLKLAALAVLLIASAKFVKVRGLLLLVALVTVVAAAMVGLFWFLSGLTFLMHPADAILTTVVGVLITIYGVVTFVVSLFGLALAIAGQVA